MILRHASPAPQGDDGTDFTRALTEVGQNEARLQGAFLSAADITPHLIVASTALRAATTAELLAGALDEPPPLRREDSLYNAPGDELLAFIQSLPDEADTVLLVAHMPGVAELVSILAADTGTLSVAFRPCTLVGISFEEMERWADVAPGSGAVEWVLPPIFAR